MFQDEAGFGRICTPKRCWAPKGVRPVVPRQHIREYQHAYGAVEPSRGESFFLVLPYTNTPCMQIFLNALSKKFSDDIILLALDQAPWHTSPKLKIPDNIVLFFLPSATPELNPIEQIWKELRKKGFKNQIFASLDKVVDRLCETINSLTKADIKSITGRMWILVMF